MERITYSNIVVRVVAAVPEFKVLLDEHVADNRAVLPHVLFGDLTRLVIAKYRQWRAGDENARAVINSVVHVLDDALAEDDPELNDLVKASFLENLGQAEDDFGGIRELLSDPMRAALDQIYPRNFMRHIKAPGGDVE